MDRKRSWIAAFAFVAFLGICQAACPNVATVNLDVSRYLGLWYEISTTETSKITFERGCDCTRANYTLNANGTVDVINTCNQHSPTGPYDVAQGLGIIPNASEPGKLKVTFGGNFYAPYWIIDVDPNYEWAVVWSCAFDIHYMWVLSRNDTMNPKLYDAITQLATQQTGFNATAGLIPTVQGSKCIYGPH